MIEIERVSKGFADSKGRSILALNDVSLRAVPGETLCLIGSSGCGKTTILRLINRMVEPDSGRILVGGRDVRELELVPLRRSMGYVIQHGGLFPHMTVAGNVGLLCHLEGWPPLKIRRRVAELLELLNLPHDRFAHQYPRDLSGGERQRVGVARALALDPECVLMDEPFGALDPITRDQVHGEFIQLRKRVRKTIVLVTHDLREAFLLGDRVALMDGGRVVQAGTEEEFRRRPASPFVEEFLQSHLGGGAGP